MKQDRQNTSCFRRRLYLHLFEGSSPVDPKREVCLVGVGAAHEQLTSEASALHKATNQAIVCRRK